MGKVYIITGGRITEHLTPDHFKDGVVIGVDRGAEWLIHQQIIPDYFIGDFDSAQTNFLEKIKKDFPDRILSFPSEKDETDTELAMKFAISLKPTEILLIGGTGTRLDHTLANIHVLLQAEQKQIPALMLDKHNRIQLLLPKQKKVIEKSDFRYVSILPLSEYVEGITLIGFKYPLHQATMKTGIPIGVSNELIATNGTISIEKGILLIIESKD